MKQLVSREWVFKKGLNVVAFNDKSTTYYDKFVDYIKKKYTLVRYDSDKNDFVIESENLSNGIVPAIFNNNDQNIWIMDVRSVYLSKLDTTKTEDDVMAYRRQILEMLFNNMNNIKNYGIICVIVTDYTHDSSILNLVCSFNILTVSNVILLNENDKYRLMKGSGFSNDIFTLEDLFYEVWEEIEEEK